MLKEPYIHFKREIERMFGLSGIFHVLNRNNQISTFILSRKAPQERNIKFSIFPITLPVK